MSIQAGLNAMFAGMRRQRSQYHLTLGKLIATLEKVPSDHIVEFDVGGAPGRPTSYRGYYEDLAFEPGAKRNTAGALLASAKDALGKTFEGYKGGDFVMDGDAPLWCASYGSCGRAVVGANVEDRRVLLVTREMDD